MEQKVYRLSDIKVVNAALGIVEAYTNTMGVIDLDGDIIEPTAFDESIANNLPIPALLGHESNAIIGKVTAASAVPFGAGVSKLYTTIQFNLDTEAGRDGFSNVAGGYVREWSVGFNVPRGAISSGREAGQVVRRIKNLDWVEVSAVLRGASPGTSTIGAKSDPSINDHIEQHTDATTPDAIASDLAALVLTARVHLYRANLGAINAATTKDYI